jgi:hypothetical protein
MALAYCIPFALIRGVNGVWFTIILHYLTFFKYYLVFIGFKSDAMLFKFSRISSSRLVA